VSVDLLCITGPTGSGKTSFAEDLSLKTGALLGSADAFQFYKEIPILSNQPEDPSRWKFVAERTISDPRSAGDFSREAQELIGKMPPDTKWIWAGTGLYLGALLYGLDSDRRRGTPFQGEARFNFKMIVLNPPRDELYAKINSRVDGMLARGAEEEARALYEQVKAGNLRADLPALKAIGLPQLFASFRKEQSLEESLSSWKQETRRLAKRQWTWLRKFCPPGENIEWKAG